MKKCFFKLFLTAVAGVAEAILIVKQMNRKLVWKEKSVTDRINTNFQVLSTWMRVKQEGGSVEKYLIGQGIHIIAIYGVAELGKHLYQELKNSEIQIAYAIDKNKTAVGLDNVPLIGLEDTFQQVDAIIVSAVYYYPEIKEDLAKITDMKVLSLEDIVGEIAVYQDKN